MQELNPTVRGSRGGWGWAQWTGPRRKAFEAFARANGLDPSSYEANYAFLRHELRGSHKGALTALKNASGLEGKTRAFENKYEGAGIKGYGSRYNYARQALKAGEAPPAENDNKTAEQNNFDANRGKVEGGTSVPSINNDRSNNSTKTIMVQAPVTVQVARADQAPSATAKAVSAAVTKSSQASASRLQSSPSEVA
jgi:hypothetical protein